MAIPKVCGIETEYGVLARGVDISAVAASSILVNAYAGRELSAIWDFSAERPHVDARDCGFAGSSFPENEYQLANTVLTNGARYYVDHAHPEVSSPECRTALEVLCWDLAADEVMRRSMIKATEHLGDAEIVAYKNNSDGKGNSYGCHENYLVDRQVPFGKLATMVAAHFVSRQIFCGSGKLGRENSVATDDWSFQLSQRADFFEEEVGLETTVRRPVVNTRDEPHSTPSKYRRLHVIVGDANMNETATFLKVGTTAIVLSMIEDGAYPEHLTVRSSVDAIKRISADTSLRTTIDMSDGRRLTAIDIQRSIFEAALEWKNRFGLSSVGEECGELVLSEWSNLIELLAVDPLQTRDRIDWVAKMHLMKTYAEGKSLSRSDPRLKTIDIQYHDLRPEKCLATKLKPRRIIDEATVGAAVTDPPRTTRAYLRGMLLQRWPDAVVAANWDSVVVDVGGDQLVRIPMAEPLRGTFELVAQIVDTASTPLDLVRALGISTSDSS
jgi:Pup amidohydrolase